MFRGNERPVRVLGIETSSRRGTVALVEGGRLVVARATETPGGHAPHLLPMLESALAEAAWSRNSIDRIAAGLGPGSFTGIRVGVALAQGVALGLGRPIVGVCSLQAMARVVPASVPGTRCALVDARRDEVFCAEYDASGAERKEPRAVARREVAAWLAGIEATVVIGEIAATLDLATSIYRDALTDLPHAAGVALTAEGLEGAVEGGPLDAIYVRPADAIPSNVPRFPLSSAGST